AWRRPEGAAAGGSAEPRAEPPWSLCGAAAARRPPHHRRGCDRAAPLQRPVPGGPAIAAEYRGAARHRRGSLVLRKAHRAAARVMKPLTILLTAGSRRVPLVQAFRSALRSLGLPGAVIVTDVNPLSPAVHVADRAYRVPMAT